METGLCWRTNFDGDPLNRVRPHVQGKDNISINGLELLATIFTAWAFPVDAKVAPPRCRLENANAGRQIVSRQLGELM